MAYEPIGPMPVTVTNELGIPGGPVTIEDGGSVTLGLKADAAVTNPATAATLISITKGLQTTLTAILTILTDVYDSGGHLIKVDQQ